MYLNQLDMPTLQWEKACNMFVYILNNCFDKALKRRHSHEKGLQLVTWKSLSHNISLYPYILWIRRGNWMLEVKKVVCGLY